MPFPFPPLWNPASVWAPKTDLNPVPGGQVNNYWASIESNFLSGVLVTVSSSLDSASADINVLSGGLGIASDPSIGASYTASYNSSSLLADELWRNTGTGFRIKETTYGYNSGSQLTGSVVRLYSDANGTTILAQATTTYFYSGSFLVSASLVRNV